MDPLVATRLATGFDRELPPVDEWLAFASSKARLEVWLRPGEREAILVALSAPRLIDVLEPAGEASSVLPPRDGAIVRSVQSVLTLHQLLRRAFQLARALPSAPLEQFQRELGEPPTRTEVERLVKQRVGQPNFRDALLEFWDGRCALTGLDVRPLLRASHIKPWAECESDAERLDVYNGVLLAAHFDAAFDGGFITFDDEGRVLVSPALSSEARQLLGLVRFSSVKLHAGRRKYLPWHRERVFGR